MIRRSAIVTLIVAAAMALGPTAFAKGPLGAMIEGEGITGSLVIDEPGELGQGTAMSALVEAAGFFPLVFGDGAVTTDPPTKAIGKQRIVITWDLGGGDSVVEEIYHRAAGGPLAYVAPGQAFWEDTAAAAGGWFRLTGDIATPLIEFGVERDALAHLLPAAPPQGPETTPTAAPPAESASQPGPPAPAAVVSAAPAVEPARTVPVGLVATVAAVAAALGATAWRSRRRPRTQ